MKIKYSLKGLLTVILFGTFILNSLNSFTNSGGAPASLTNAPGEGNCTQCHNSYNLDSTFSTGDNLSVSGNFTGGGYIPDSSYTITLSQKNSSRSKFGFQLTCLDQIDSMAGSFTNTSARTSKISGSGKFANREYMRQTSSGTSGSGGNISWSFTWKAPSNNLDSVIFYAVLNSANGSGTGNDSISVRKFKIGPSSLLPDASFTQNKTTMCAGDTVTFSGSSSDSNATYSWSFPNAIPSSSSMQNPKVVYNIAGTHTASLVTSNSKGSSPSVKSNILVSASPPANIIGGNRTICQGDSVQIIAAFSPGASYLWSNGQSGSNTIYAKDSGDYSVTVSQGNCSKTSGTIHVGYYSKPMVSLSSSLGSTDSVCSTTNLTLQTTGVADSFIFYANDQVISRQTTSSYAVTIDTSTQFHVQSRNSNGCLSDLAGLHITVVNPLPGPPMSCTVVSQTELEFSWTGAIYHNGFEVSQDSGVNWIAPSNGTGSNSHDITGLQPEQSVELYLRALDDAPCLYSEISKLSCATDSCETLPVSITAADKVCKGDEVNVIIKGLSSYNYALNFEGNGWTKDTTFSFNPTLSKNYSVLIQDSGKLVCPAQEFFIPITVEYLGGIDLEAIPSGPVFCEGDTVSFSVNDSISNVQFIYNEQDVQNGSGIIYKRNGVLPNDSLYVISTYESCIDTSELFYLSVLPSPDASFMFSRVGPNYTFTPNVNSYSAYLWDFGDGEQSSMVSPVHDYSSSEDSKVDATLMVTDDQNCTASSTEEVNVPDFASVSLLKKLGLKVYPSPVIDQLTIENQGALITLKVYTVNHHLVKEVEIAHGSHVLDLSSLSAGPYILQFVNESELVNYQLLKH
ncbi:MAG: PKD domain-containing protein [Bacteroidia bacterium]